MHVWALGLSRETPAAPPDRAAGARTRQPENSKRAHFRAPALQNTTKIPREDPQRDTERSKQWREKEEKTRNFGPPTLRGPTFGAHPFGAHPSGAPPFRGPRPFGVPTLRDSPPFGIPHPSGPHPSGPHPFGAPPFRGPTLSGPHPFGAPPFRGPTLSGPHSFGAPPFRGPTLWESKPTFGPPHFGGPTLRGRFGQSRSIKVGQSRSQPSDHPEPVWRGSDLPVINRESREPTWTGRGRAPGVVAQDPNSTNRTNSTRPPISMGSSCCTVCAAAEATCCACFHPTPLLATPLCQLLWEG